MDALQTTDIDGEPENDEPKLLQLDFTDLNNHMAPIYHQETGYGIYVSHIHDA